MYNIPDQDISPFFMAYIFMSASFIMSEGTLCFSALNSAVPAENDNIPDIVAD
mgnify:CR=1 FL=1